MSKAPIIFDQSYIIDPITGCWNWTRMKSSRGYAQLTRAGKTYYAHRFSFEKFKRKLQQGEVVNHRCNNVSCVNPEHLEATDQAGNVRYGKAAKLSVSDVQEIKQLLYERKDFITIAARFNVSPSTIRSIRYGQQWIDVKRKGIVNDRTSANANAE